MNLIKRNTLFGALDPLFDTDSFFNDFNWPMRRIEGEAPGLVAPRIDIHEKDGAYVVSADLPGVKKEDIDVSLEEGMLSIKAQTSGENSEEEEGKVIRRERHFGSYLRRLSLGQSVNQSDVVAEFSDGVLTVMIPKNEPEEAQPKRVEVK